MEREHTRMNPEMLDWNWRPQHHEITFNMFIEIDYICTDMYVCVYTQAQTHMHMFSSFVC